MRPPRQTQAEDVFDPDENDVRAEEVQSGSAVIRINDAYRQCHLASILPSSEATENADTRRPIDFRVYYEAAGYLALQHFNERNPRVLPDLPERLKDCNVQLSMEMRDTRFSPIYAAQHLQQILQREHSLATPAPISLVGAARSAVSQTLSILGGVYEIPQVSASSTSASLDNKDSSPFFARTVPTNYGDAKATIMYFQSLGVTHMGVIYIRDEFGTSFHSQILDEANKAGIQVVSTSFDGHQNSIVTGVRQLQESGLTYFMGIFNPSTWKSVVREAQRAGIIGTSNHAWLLSDASQELTQPGFRLNRETEADLAAAVDGTGVVLLNVESNTEFDKALSELESDPVLQESFVNAHVEPSVFDGYDFPFPGSALYQYLNYDAVMALGIAACEAPRDFFTGPELYETLLQTEFVGVSGLVRFDDQTGTRDEQGLKYNIENVRIAQNGTNEQFYTFNSVTAVEVDFANTTMPITSQSPFVYSGGSTQAPPTLPPNDVELNLIPRGIRVTGLLFGSLSMFCAFCWMMWTIYYRNIDVVRIAQPVFLCQLCVGAFIMATAVIPMSMQEPVSERRLDMACMATPWLLSIGFVTAFSALFSKSWRLNKLFQSGKSFRRVQVKARDVILPFLLLSGLNVAILTTWTIVAPLEWTRRWSNNLDQFGRPVESYGTCYGGSNDVAQYVFMALILLVNFAAVLCSLYQSYRARNLPTDFNESYYISVSTFSLLETMILGGPLIVLVHDNPSADFLIKAVLVTIVCFTILLFMFVPKYLQRNIRQRMKKSHGNGGGARRRTAARISQGNRFSTFSSVPGGDRGSSSGAYGASSGPSRVSLQGRRSSQRSSTASYRSGMRASFDAPQPTRGKSPICRNERYYEQRRSADGLQNRRTSVFRRSADAEELPAVRRSLPHAVSPGMASRRGSPVTASTSVSSSLKSKPSASSLSSSGRTDANSKRATSINIAEFDPPAPKLHVSFDDIREASLDTTEKSSAESAEGVEVVSKTAGDERV